MFNSGLKIRLPLLCLQKLGIEVWKAHLVTIAHSLPSGSWVALQEVPVP